MLKDIDLEKIPAVILCGGKATRLGPLSNSTPKSLMRVRGKTVLEHQVDFLRSEGIKKIHLLLGHLSEKIISHLDKSMKYKGDITYTTEEAPLGTAGALKNANKSLLASHFFLFNGDTLINHPLQEFLILAKNNPEAHVLSVYKNESGKEYGQVLLAADGKAVSGFVEKPSQISFPSYQNAGLCLFNKSLLDELSHFNGPEISLEKEVLPRLVGKLFALKLRAPFFDIGTPVRLKEANESQALPIN